MANPVDIWTSPMDDSADYVAKYSIKSENSVESF